MTRVHAGKVLQAFYALRQAQWGIKPPAFFRKKAYAQADLFLQWAAANDLSDPIGYLNYRLKIVAHHKRCPQLASLRNAAYLQQYRSERPYNPLADETRFFQALTKRSGTPFDQYVRAQRLLVASHEIFRRRYAERERPMLCLAQTAFSGGFHPSSAVCPRCPVAVRCAEKIRREAGFDIVALRAGRFEQLPPAVVHAICEQGSG